MSKFDCEQTEELYEEWMNGGADEELGDSQTFGYYAKFNESYGKKAAILHEDSQGFVDSQEYDSQESCDKRWEEIEMDYDEWSETTDKDSFDIPTGPFTITDDGEAR